MNDPQDLHLIKPEGSELTIGYAIERVVEFVEKNGAFPRRITTRPKNYIKLCYFMDTFQLRKPLAILGVPVLIKVGDNEPFLAPSTPV